MSTNEKIIRMFLGVAATMVVLLVGLSVVPSISEWYESQLVTRMTSEITAADDLGVKIPLRQLASLGRSSIEPLVVAAASQRAAVATIARQILEEKLTTWQVTAKSARARIGEHEYIHSCTQLAVALGTHVEEFGPAGKQWAERLALTLIQMSDRMPARKTQLLLGNCSRILAAVPPRGSRLQTVNVGQVTPTPYTPDRLPAAMPRLESLTPASEISLERLARIPTSSSLSISEQPSPVPSTNSTFQHNTAVTAPRTNGSSLRWSMRNNGNEPRLPISVPALPSSSATQQPNASPSTGLVKMPHLQQGALNPPPRPGNSSVVDVPTPKAMQTQAATLRLQSTDELLLQLISARHFEAGALRTELVRRGYTLPELTAYLELSAPDVQVRLRLVEDATRLPAASTRRVLRWLLADAEADVRLRALTALATTNAPELATLARDLAAKDEDPRVAKLASQLLKRRR